MNVRKLMINLMFGCCVLLLRLSIVLSNGENTYLKSNRTESVYYFNSSSSTSNLVFAILMPTEVHEGGNSILFQKVMPAVELAVNKIQQPGYLIENFNITVVARDTFCSSIYGPIGFFEIYKTYKLNAVLGLSCDYVLAPISRYAGVWEIPVLASSGFPKAFNVKPKQYPTLTRIMGSYTEIGDAIKGILDMFNWTTTTIIYQNHDENSNLGNSDCYLSMGSINDVLNTVDALGFSGIPKKEKILEILNKIRNLARIVVMCADPQSIRQIMLAAEELNMIDSGEYVFFNIELFSSLSQANNQPWDDKNDTFDNNLRAKKAYTALLTVTAKLPDDEKYLEFSQQVKDIAAEKYNFTFNQNETVSTFVTAFYDAVLLYAYALNDSITHDPSVLTRPINGTDMVRLMWNRTFQGITGNVTIDKNGDRISSYSLLDMNPESGNFEIVAHYFYNHLEYVEGKNIHWAGGRTEPPPNQPVCGYDGSLCPALPGYAILSLVLGFVVVLMAIISFFGYRHYKSEAEINSMIWRIYWHEVMPCDSLSKYRGSVHSIAKRGSQLTVYSEDLGSLAGDRQLFIPVGIYKGCKVAIKQIDESNINLNRSLMLELKKMKDIQHDHLVKFYGACVDPPKCCILTEYCPKGSLQDILENDQIKLDWMFKLSLMHDIVRGMHFLHQSDIKSHGNLKSSNCVVDSRFVLKISDFGLHNLRKRGVEDDEENCNSYVYWKRLLWTAPELLRIENAPLEGTQKGDVYSFGIICHEITTRQGPFFLGIEQDDKSPQEIVELVKNYPKGMSVPFRPQMDDGAFDDINQIMVKCWAEDPCERPDFSGLKSTIRKINKDNETGNIVDNLLQRMEQYANNLEGLVEERTHDYLEEKKKCERLLYQLLPESVAAQLIRGQPVMAEIYDQVTIYFSDIVGFTAISAESTPMQVVSFLNDLYTCFDSIVENFDVYKVETIGDAYMVVSGLPVRNGNLHAREISRLALALLRAVKKFSIRHRPNDQLKLRIGLHSGPCVAGVVGLKMPRYCLFGDTVNTASRMESNGEALKIHISQKTKEILDQFGTFDVLKRGEVEMKGKGKMLTYWLTGENQTNNCSPDVIKQQQQQEHQQQFVGNLNGDLKTDEPQEMCNKENIDNDDIGDNDIEDVVVDVDVDDDRPPPSYTTTGNGNPPNMIPNSSCSTSNACSNNGSNNHSDLVKRNTNSNSLNFNSMVKSNNLKNLKTNKCNISDDNVKSVTQPLLAKINS